MLASRGLPANSVIVADDENLEIARAHGFATVEMGNDDLGAKFNAGYAFAAKRGADIFVHIGSDDWIHPDALNVVLERDLTDYMPDLSQGMAVWRKGPEVVAQRGLSTVDLATGVAQRCRVRGVWGCIPWIIPRNALKPRAFKPIPRGYQRGIDGALARRLPRVNWTMRDVPPEWLVDLKTEWNITPFKALSSIHDGPSTTPTEMLAPFYPAELVARVAAWT